MDSTPDRDVEHIQVPCRYALRTHVGKRRSENQDSHGYVRTSNGHLFIVADGMGGAQGGATASALAVELIAKTAVDQSGVVSIESLRNSIERANRAIFEYSQTDEGLAGMGTTVVALAVFSDRVVVAHVGDSRIYQIDDGAITPLTRDHTLIQEMIDAGTISPEQAENHPISHMLTRSLGPTPQVEVEVRRLETRAEQGTRFLLCCDGLINHVTDDEIGKVIASKPLDEAADMLIELANQRGGTDNITVEVIEVVSAADQVELPSAGERDFHTSAETEFADENGILHRLVERGIDPDGSMANGEIEVDDDIASTQSSAVDGIIFGELPTGDDIKRHEDKVSKKSVGTVEIEDDEPIDDIEDFEPEDDEEFDVDEEGAADELRQLRRVQFLGAVTVIGAIGVSAYVLMPIEQPPAPAPTPPQAEQPEAPVELPATIAAVDTPAPTVDDAEPTPTETTEPVSETPDDTATVDAATSDVADDSESTDAALIDDEAPADADLPAWPVAQVIPGQPASSAPQQAPAIEPIAIEPTVVTPDAALDGDAPEDAALEPADSEEPSAEPVASAPVVPTPPPAPVNPEVAQLRGQQVAAKLSQELYSINTPADAKARVEELRSELEARRGDHIALVQAADDAQTSVDQWNGWQSRLAAGNFAELVKELPEGEASAVREANQTYLQASLTYLETLEAWQIDQQDAALSEKTNNARVARDDAQNAVQRALATYIADQIATAEQQLKQAQAQRTAFETQHATDVQRSKALDEYTWLLGIERKQKLLALDKELEAITIRLLELNQSP